MDRRDAEMDMPKCTVCGKTSETGVELCPIHLKALRNLETAFKNWREAYQNKITLREYLEGISKLAETGPAAMEVVQKILKGELEWERKLGKS